MSKHMGTPRRIMSGRRTRFGPLVAITAALALLLGMFGLNAPAQATGNQGTIKVHALGSEPGTESNEPHVCAFNLEFYNFVEDFDGYIEFDVQGGDGPTGVAAGPYAVGSANADGYFESEYFNVEGGPTILNGHYKVTLYGKFNDGRINYEDIKAKSKVFKVDCPAPPVEPEGGNTSFSSDCESITVGTPTGVKPEGATVVVKLNGEVTQPGTYAVAAGEYTVTTYVNGTLVDTDVVVVAKCEDEVEPEGNLSVSSTCESITFSSNGVKPEGAEQVFKLDGVVKAAGTYAVTAGSHTVELYVNGELVDSKTIVVEACEDEVTPVAPTEPTPSDVCEPATGTTNDRITIPSDANFTYQVDGKGVVAGQVVATGTSHTVTAVPNKDVVVKEGAKTSWTFTFTKVACVVTPPPVVVPPVVTPPVVVPPVVNPPVKRDNPSASVKASCVTAHWGEGVAKLNNKRSDVKNTFRIVKTGRDKIVTVKAGVKKVVGLTGLRVGSVVKVVVEGKTLAKTKVPAGCEPTPVPDTGFRMAASKVKSAFRSAASRLFGA